MTLVSKAPAVLVASLTPTVIPAIRGSVGFSACLAEVRNGAWGLTGGTDNYGHPVSDISQATAITYELCSVACGSAQEPFQWNLFSQRFSAWLMPYLALASQLPFGASGVDNLVSVLLTVGSPTLAAYSLALTVLNGHWITRRFSGISYPNAKNAVKILSDLQQSSLEVNTKGSLLASLVVLHKNDEFWEELSVWLNYGHTWSISAVASILWVVIAYVFPVVDSFTEASTFLTPNENGLAVVSIFLWLLPIVVGWLQISPECDAERVHQAMEKANKIAYVASLDGDPILASELSNKRAICLRKDAGEIRRDEQRTPPIYNYARFFPWTSAAEHVYCAFREASERSHSHQPVSGNRWLSEKEDRNMKVHHLNHRGSLAQVTTYLNLTPAEIFPHPRSRWGSGVVSRFLLAAFVALCLTWGTTGAAMAITYYTPTKGLTCRLGSYLIYGILSALVWMMMVISSVLAHYSTFAVSFKNRYMHTKSTRLAGGLSIILRRLGKILATINVIWIVLACLFQFGGFFDSCWCDSSVFYLGAKSAYNVVDISPDDVAALNVPWIAAVLASGCAMFFMGFVNVMINPVLPD
ncbi:hypothetical protein C8J57DRAFT_1074373 [Mycena rebaudengoi]|nr:hypothetical protein C8J57DRAFT_1074373 [Mycena rebaudengoi]